MPNPTPNPIPNPMPPRLPARRLIAALLAAVAVALVTTSCAANPREDRVSLAAELAARDSLEVTVARYERMLATIRQRLDAEFGPHAWYTAYQQGGGGCEPEFPTELGGRKVSLVPWGFPSAISDQEWPRVIEIITPVLAENGFAPGGLGINKPGQHLLYAFDTRLGAHFRLGSVVHTSIAVTTGCHLPAATRNTTAPGPTNR